VPTIRTQEIETVYERSGRGTPLVLLHGGFVDRHMWQPQVAALAQHYQVIWYDLRGHGQTGPSPRPTCTLELLADDLHALLDGLDMQRAIICGLSLGGMVAQAFAARYPQMLAALVMADTAVSLGLTWMDRLQRDVLAPHWAYVLTLGLLGTQRFVDGSFWLANATRSAQWLGREAAVRDYVQQAMRQITPPEYIKLFGALYAFAPVDLSVVQVPTLLLNGEHESASVYRHAHELQRRIPHAEMATIPDAGHLCNLDNPAAFTEVVRDFLVRHGV
jgi:pimeloyl-ACP methyl ester carboxylesterase